MPKNPAPKRINDNITDMNRTGSNETREYSPLESTPEGVEISINFEKEICLGQPILVL